MIRHEPVNMSMIEMKFNDRDNSPLPGWLCANAKGGRGMSFLIILMAFRYKLFLGLFIAAMIFSAAPAACQDFPMLHYTVEDGLPSNTVYSVYRDSKGFLWIATDKGIARYNGIKFETFTTFNGLPDNEIFFFKEDYSGRLWLGTFNGELCYYKDDTFHTAANTTFLKLPFKTSYIWDMLMQKDSSINITFLNSYQFINIKGDKANIIDLYKVTDTDKVTDYFYKEKVSETSYKIYSHQNIVIIDTNFKILKINHFNFMQFENRLDYFRSVSNQNNTYIINHHLICDSNLHIIRQIDTNITLNYFIHNIYHSNLGWMIATDHGVFINDTLNLLSDNNVSNINQDENKNYWISTLGNGLFVCDNDFIKSRIFKNAYKGEVKYTSYCKNHFFFVTSKKINRIYALDKDKCENIFSYENSNPNDSKFSSAFLIDSNCVLYNANNVGITVINDLRNRPLAMKKYFCNVLPVNVIKTMLLKNDHIYINAKNRLLDLDLARLRRCQKFEYTYIDGTNRFERVFDIAKSADNNIWFSDIKNVYKVKDDRSIIQPQFKNIAFKSLAFFGKYLVGYTHNNCLLICENIEKNISVDSVGNQDCVWENFYRLDSLHVLISTKNLYRLLTFNQGIADKKFAVSVVENPFIPPQAEAICSDGKNCYFFKNGSITSLDVESILVKPGPPNLFFTVVKAGKRTYHIQNEIEIPYRLSKNISILFSTLSFSGKNVSYQFSAVSKDDSDLWRDVTGDALNLYNLGYGRHTIKLRAKSISSDYSQPIVFSLYILRPFWATWWFITLCTAAFLAVLGLLIRTRIVYLLQKNKKEHESEVKFMKSEYKALNALMNPHFIFNTLNNVQSLVNENNKLAANEYLRVFADLIRQNMHNLSKELIPLQKEMDLVTNYLALEKLRFEDKLTYTISIDENIDLSDIMVPPLLIQPLVENSIKHGILPQKNSSGTIGINVYEKQGTLYIEVKDNGAGISSQAAKTESLHESFGLENIKTRIQQLSIIQDKDISLSIREIKGSTGNIEGTIVTITMPISE